MSWICPHQRNNNFCGLRKKKCDVFSEGCILEGKGGSPDVPGKIISVDIDNERDMPRGERLSSMENMEHIKSKIRQYDNIVITCHINPDGDAIGSMLALGIGLEVMGKKVSMICKDDIPHRYGVLPYVNRIRKTPETGCAYEFAITVDCGSIDILGMDPELLRNADDVLEIDHHQVREPFGTMSIIDHDAASNGEIIYALLEALEIDITRDIAQCILTSIIVETNSFRLPSVRPLTFYICSELMKTGVDFSGLTETVYWVQSPEAVLLTGICLSRCKFCAGGKVVWSIVKQEDFNDTNGLDEDVDAVADTMRSIHGVEAVAFFREQDDSSLRVSLRSKGNVNIAEVAKEYSGGGHYDVAGCSVPNDNNIIFELLGKIIDLVG